jgi:SH3-like domain-containing protein
VAKNSSIFFANSLGRLRVSKALLGCALLLSATGCSRFHRHSTDTVYVSARQTYLHDRVAAVSNRVAGVTNGQVLEVLDRNRRFLKVKTDKNQIGWIEERAVIDTKTYAAFQQLSDQHKNDVVTAQASLRDDLYMHLTPGRTAEHFYLIPGNTKVQLLMRASVQRTNSNATAPAPKPAAPVTPPNGAKPATEAPAPVAAAPPPMEDWWLVRDGQGRTGWLLSSRLDVDVPDAIGLYAEGQHIVGAWPLAQVTDVDDNGASHTEIEYLMALSAPKAGLPYDFDQLRVFTWNLKRHRYETAFRMRNIRGYLPLHVTQATGNGPASFQFLIANNDKAMADPATGAARPVVPRMLSYQLIQTRVMRTGPDMGPLPNFGGGDDDKNKKDAKKKHK